MSVAQKCKEASLTQELVAKLANPTVFSLKKFVRTLTKIKFRTMKI